MAKEQLNKSKHVHFTIFFVNSNVGLDIMLLIVYLK